MSRSTIACAVAAALLGALSSASAQLTKPTISPPTVYTAPAAVVEIYVYDGGPYVAVHFPSVTGASGYRLTRVDNSIANPPEVLVAEGAASVFLGANGIYMCDPAQSKLEYRRCGFRDPADNVWVDPNEPNPKYRTHVDPILIKGHSYSYRVFALYSDGRVSASSPVATLAFNHDSKASVPLLP